MSCINIKIYTKTKESNNIFCLTFIFREDLDVTQNQTGIDTSHTPGAGGGVESSYGLDEGSESVIHINSLGEKTLSLCSCLNELSKIGGLKQSGNSQHSTGNSPRCIEAFTLRDHCLRANPNSFF